MTAFVPTAATQISSATRTYHATPTRPTTTTPAALPHPHAALNTTLSSPPPPAPPSHPTRILVWFHNDLRIVDNPALHAAAQHSSLPGGALVPLHAGSTDISMLSELKAHLQSAGSSLLSLSAPVEKAIVDVCERLKLTAVYYNRSIHKDCVRIEARVERALKEVGVSAEGFWGNVLLPPPADLSKQTTLKALTHHAVKGGRELSKFLEAPQTLSGLPSAAASIPQNVVVATVGGGTAAAQRLLAGMEKRSEIVMMRRPDLAVLLKKHLDAGTISPRMIAARVFVLFGKLQGRTFSELVWRSFVAFEAHRAVGVRAQKRVAV